MQCTLLLGTLLLWEGGVLLGVFGLVVIPVVVGFFCLFFFFFPPPLAFLTADPQTALFPRLCSFHLRSWLSLRAFVHADKLFWHVHRAYIAGARPAHSARCLHRNLLACAACAAAPSFLCARASLLALLALLGLRYLRRVSFPRRGQDHLQLEGR